MTTEEQRIQTDTSRVYDALTGYWTPSRIDAWVDSPNAHLGERSPRYLIRHGQTAEVLAAIAAIRAGAYA